MFFRATKLVLIWYRYVLYCGVLFCHSLLNISLTQTYKANVILTNYLVQFCSYNMILTMLIFIMSIPSDFISLCICVSFWSLVVTESTSENGLCPLVVSVITRISYIAPGANPDIMCLGSWEVTLC